MAATAARIQLLRSALDLHQDSRDQLAAALRCTRSTQERNELLIRHAEACRCATAFEQELAEAMLTTAEIADRNRRLMFGDNDEAFPSADEWRRITD
jgi:hypothetical protein